ncbi:MAG: bifunctional nuclease family protein [Candidatus Omnitrophica bacterium]|nr:bifunctional nuclease family protein [Candidatus Omnitrophota bacterium]
MTSMVEMELNKIVIDEKRHDQLIVLKEKNGTRLLPIVIGLNEASAIKLKISGFQPPRPLTHDLLHSTIENLEASIDRVIIDKLEENTFHAKLILKTRSGDTKTIDARPSDTIALAVRAHAPIFVEDAIIKQSEIFEQNK